MIEQQRVTAQVRDRQAQNALGLSESAQSAPDIVRKDVRQGCRKLCLIGVHPVPRMVRNVKVYVI